MTNEEFKKLIEERTGVPAALLTGETAEENVRQAQALLNYKKANEGQQQAAQPQAEQPKEGAPRDQFADWFYGKLSRPAAEVIQDNTDQALDTLGNILGYPTVPDGGEIPATPTGNSPRDQFAEWLYRNL